jgi:uncharacterized membrane protein
VVVAFPNPRLRSVGFVTGEQHGLGGEKLLSVFVPTTPNPTSGFLLLLPKRDIIELEMSVGDGMKMVISGGTVVPPASGGSREPLPAPNPAPGPAAARAADQVAGKK